MAVYDDGSSSTKGILGVTVRKSATALVLNSANALFTITGGPVVVTSLFGVVTTAIPNTASLTAKFTFTPTGGSIADLTAATAIDNDALGNIYGWSYPDGDELVSQLSFAGTEVPSVNFAPILLPPAVLPAGAITFTVSNHTVTPGAAKWYITYVPMDAGTVVTAT